MAKLVLKSDTAVRKELPLLNDMVSIGRLSDNTLQIDNSDVSSRHCRVVFEDGKYFVEDKGSTNGTFVNQQRVTRAQLIHGDELTIGNQTLTFVDVEDDGAATKPIVLPLPRADKTVMFEARKMQDMLAAIKTGIADGMPANPATPAPAANQRTGTLTVLHGKTDQPEYVLTRRLLMIGKSNTAAIRLKGFFAPKAAAVINRREGKYFVTRAEKSARIKVKVNEADVGAPQELKDGDILEVAKVKMTFSYNE